VNIDSYADLGGPMFADIKNPTVEAEAYTYQKKIFVAVADPSLVPPKGTAVVFRSQHRQVGKTETLNAVVDGGRAVMVTGDDFKADKKKVPASHPRAHFCRQHPPAAIHALRTQVSEKSKPCEDGETVFQLRHVYCLNLEASNKKLDKWQLYSSIESYTDGTLGGNPENGRLYFMMTNDLFKCGQGEVGENLSATRVNFYEIVGMGEPYSDPNLGMRYHDYDIVPDTMMRDRMLAKGDAKFEVADASKKASEAGVDTDVYVFFKTFDTGSAMMLGKDMAKTLRSKHECFNSFISGKTQHFEKDKFHKWLKDHGHLLTSPGVIPEKYKLNGGALGEMTIVYKNYSGTPKYNLQLR
jgi:hypothetical protein